MNSKDKNDNQSRVESSSKSGSPKTRKDGKSSGGKGEKRVKSKAAVPDAKAKTDPAGEVVPSDMRDVGDKERKSVPSKPEDGPGVGGDSVASSDGASKTGAPKSEDADNRSRASESKGDEGSTPIPPPPSRPAPQPSVETRKHDDEAVKGKDPETKEANIDKSDAGSPDQKRGYSSKHGLSRADVLRRGARLDETKDIGPALRLWDNVLDHVKGGGKLFILCPRAGVPNGFLKHHPDVVLLPSYRGNQPLDDGKLEHARVAIGMVSKEEHLKQLKAKGWMVVGASGTEQYYRNNSQGNKAFLSMARADHSTVSKLANVGKKEGDRLVAGFIQKPCNALVTAIEAAMGHKPASASTPHQEDRIPDEIPGA